MIHPNGIATTPSMSGINDQSTHVTSLRLRHRAAKRPPPELQAVDYAAKYGSINSMSDFRAAERRLNDA